MPVLGQIAAGVPITAEEVVEDVFPLPRQIVGEGSLFLLKVVGDSMVDAAICDGDWVVVRQQPSADNGDIVAAMLDNEATVKTFKRKDGKVWLHAAQPGVLTRSTATTPRSSARSRRSCAASEPAAGRSAGSRHPGGGQSSRSPSHARARRQDATTSSAEAGLVPQLPPLVVVRAHRPAQHLARLLDELLVTGRQRLGRQPAAAGTARRRPPRG